METVLVTGGAGYLGSVLVPCLLRLGYRVRVLDLFRHPSTGLAACAEIRDFEPVRGDCREMSVVKECVKDADWIIPLAAVVGAPACDRNMQDAVTTNLGAVVGLLGQLSQNQRVLFPNTNSGYGRCEYATEETPLEPVSLYGRTKKEAEEAVLARSESVVFRLATLFGASPRMRTDLLVNDFVFRAVRDRTLVVFEGHYRRNSLHVRDAAEVFLFGMRQFGSLKERVYNVAHPQGNITKTQLCRLIGRLVPGFQWVNATYGSDPDQRDCFVSTDRIRSCGFFPVNTLEDGVEELMRFYKMMPPGDFTNA